jgi:hypothetical protein
VGLPLERPATHRRWTDGGREALLTLSSSLMVKTNKAKEGERTQPLSPFVETIRSGLVSRGGLVKGRVENLVAANLGGAFHHSR